MARIPRWVICIGGQRCNDGSRTDGGITSETGRFFAKRMFPARFHVLAMLGILATCWMPPLLAGNNVWSSAGLVDAECFVQDPLSPATMYLGTWGSGVLKSTDAGITWSTINNGSHVMHVHSLIMNPDYPSVLYVAGSGICKTTDGGRSWSSVSWEETWSLAMDPLSPDTIYAGTPRRGIFKTVDGGANWCSVGGDFYDVITLAAAPSERDTIYAGTDGSGIFKSTDGGSTWIPASTGLTTGDIQCIVVHPTDSCAVWAGTGGGGVFRSGDGGTTWIPSSDGLLGMYPNIVSIIIDETQPETLYVAEPWDGLFRSDDAGSTWTEIKRGLPGTEVQSIAIDERCPFVLYAGNSDGLYRSTDRGQHWSDPEHGLHTSTIRALAVDPTDPSILYAAAQEGIAKTTDGGKNWYFLENGLTAEALIVSPTSPSTLFASDYSLYRTLDGGSVWEFVDLGPQNGAVTAMAMAPSEPSTMYVATDGGGLLKCNDGGTIWTPAGAGLKNWVTSLAFDPRDASVAYAGVFDGGVYKTVDGGQEWVPLMSEDEYGVVTPVVLLVDPAQPSTVFAGESSGFYRTEDGGESWDLVFPGGEGVLALAPDPLAPGTIYTGGGAGVRVTKDHGKTWDGITEGMVRADVDALALSPSQSPTLFAGTYGESLWAITFSCVSCDAEFSPSCGEVPLRVSFLAHFNSEGCPDSPNYSWSFGDGTTSDEPSPDHVYEGPGEYEWTLVLSVGGSSCTQRGIVAVVYEVPGDCDGDGQVSIGEVQKAVNMFLGTLALGCGVDCNGDGAISIGEVQKVINAFLGVSSSC